MSPPRRPLRLGLALAALVAARAAAVDRPGPPRLVVEAAAAVRARGEALYADGLRAPGQPVEGRVAGDVAVSGEQVRCAACHGRSGLGRAEAGEVTPAITGPALAAPRQRHPGARPGYDVASLGRALRQGIDPGGRRLGALMPRYQLSDAEVAALAAHLDSLGRPAPGASDREVHVATIVAPDATPAAASATLDVVRDFVRRQNEAARIRRERHPREIAARTAPGSRNPFAEMAEREGGVDWVLHEWRLSGPAAGWEAQLRARLRAEPVFAVVSGAAGPGWAAVQAFCERERLPCLLPNLEAPPPAAEGWYTLHFSPGLPLEGRVAARHLAALGVRRVLQAHRAAGAPAAEALAAAVARGGDGRVTTVPLAGGAPLHPAALAAQARREGAGALVLWIQPGDVAALCQEPLPADLPVLLSSSLLGFELAAARACAGGATAIHAAALPAEAGRRWPAVSASLRAAGHGPASSPAAQRLQDLTLFALRAFADAYRHASEGAPSRELLVETLEHADGLLLLPATLGRASFGPGQRFLVKGAWLLPLSGPEAQARWVVP